MIKHIIWDFDGTLYNTYPKIAEVFQATLHAFHINENLCEILEKLHISMGHTIEYYANKHNLSVEILREQFVKNEENMDVFACTPFEGMMQILDHVQKNNGKNFIYTNRGKSTFRFLDAQKHTHLFSEIITRECGYGKKPSPKAILYVIKTYGLDKNQTLMVGDRDIDIQAAKQAGIQSCYFDSHKISPTSDPDYQINSLYELKPLLL